MLLSAFADEVSTDIKTQVDFLVENEIDYIELRSADSCNIIEHEKDMIHEIRRILVDNNIKVSAIASPIGKVKIDHPFEEHFDKFKYAVELADVYNTKMIRVFSYYPADDKYSNEKYREIVIDRMSKQAEALKGTDIIMVHENEAGIYGHTADNCLDIVQSVNSLNLKLAYDPANFVWGEGITDSFESCWLKMKPYVEHVHIKDWKKGETKVGSLPGDGDGQIKELVEDLIKSDYKGFLTLEPHLQVGGQFGGETGPKLFRQAIDSLRRIIAESNQ